MADWDEPGLVEVKGKEGMLAERTRRTHSASPRPRLVRQRPAHHDRQGNSLPRSTCPASAQNESPTRSLEPRHSVCAIHLRLLISLPAPPRISYTQMEQISPMAAARGSSKSTAAGSSSEAAVSVTKRLSQELMNLMMTSPPGISAFPKSEANLFEWAGTIEGAAGTIYSGLTFKISITFPPNYPYAAPTIKFDTPCYHPNVDLAGGAICLDILQDKWTAVYSVQTVLLSLQSLLGEPNNASPLNPDAANLWDKPDEYKTQLMKHYRPISDDA